MKVKMLAVTMMLFASVLAGGVRIAGTPASDTRWAPVLPRPIALHFQGQRSPTEPALPGEDTTIIAYDDGIHRTWWCSDRDSFGAAVRFTPGAYPCQVVGTKAEVGYDEGQQIFLRVYDDDGPDGKPGTVLYEELRLDIPPGQNVGFRDYDMDSSVTVDDGDFYICFFQKHWFHLLFGTDTHFDSISRQWWYFPDWGWVTPMGMDAADQLIRAKVLYPTGIAAELTGADRHEFSITPSLLAGGFATIRYSLPAIAQAQVSVCDVSGRVVLRQALRVRREGSSMHLDLRRLPAGAYLVKLTAGGYAATCKLVIQR
jgi:hypothetical protein